MVKQKKMMKGPSAPMRGPKPAQAAMASKNGKKAQRRKAEEEEVEEVESGEEGFKGEEWEGEEGSEGEGGGASSSEDDSDSEDEEEEIKMFGQVEEEEDEEESDEEPPAKDTGKGKGKGKGKEEESKKRKRKGKKGEDSLMNITFEVSDPHERFFFGIRSLLSYLTHEDIPVSSLSEWVVSEPGLGSVVHCAEENDVFALATAIPLARHKSNEAVAALHTLLESRCPPSLLPSLRTFLKDEGTYLLLHHRFVNLPLPLVPALHKSIREDLDWALKNTKGLPKVKSLLLLCPCSAEVGPSSSSSGDGKGKARKAEGKGKGKEGAKGGEGSVAYAPSDAIYTHFEDEMLVQRSELSFCFKRRLSEEGNAKVNGEEVQAGAMVVCVVGDRAHQEAIPEMEEMAGQLG